MSSTPPSRARAARHPYTPAIVGLAGSGGTVHLRVKMVLRVALAAAVLAVTIPAGSASGARVGGSGVGGTLVTGDKEPVEGVTIVVKQDGTEIGRAMTDERGEWQVEVPGAGTYQVALDVDTLPEGVALRDPDRQTLDRVSVREGLTKPVRFALGEGAKTGLSRVERFTNLFVDGIRLGLILAVASVGLSLIFGVTGLTNFAHGELVTFGALAAFFFSASGAVPEIPLVVAGVLAVVAGGALGWAHERILFRPLRRRRSGTVSLIVVTIGLGLFLRNLFLILFGGRPRPFDEFTIQKALDLGPISLRPKDLAVMAVSVTTLVAVGLVLQRTRMGRATRAVADSSDLAAASGIDVDRVILAVWVGGAALAALGGVMHGVSSTIESDMGFGLLMLMFAAVVLGGIGTAYGAMAGGLVIGVASQLSTYWLEPKHRIGVALAVLIGTILVRPQGILGRKERIG